MADPTWATKNWPDPTQVKNFWPGPITILVWFVVFCMGIPPWANEASEWRVWNFIADEIFTHVVSHLKSSLSFSSTLGFASQHWVVNLLNGSDPQVALIWCCWYDLSCLFVSLVYQFITAPRQNFINSFSDFWDINMKSLYANIQPSSSEIEGDMGSKLAKMPITLGISSLVKGSAFLNVQICTFT